MTPETAGTTPAGTGMTAPTSGLARVGEIELAWEQFGDSAAPPIVLIVGFGAQSVQWPIGFVRRLVDAGHRVIRFDNRDIGLSTILDGVRAPRLDPARMARHWFGLPSPAPYTLFDMADDTVGLLDALELDRVHLVGESMGGMIAQIVAGRNPERVRSLGIVHSSTLQPFLPPPRTAAIRAMLTGPEDPADPESVLGRSARAAMLLGSPGYPRPYEEHLDLARACYVRSHHPAGVIRQLAALTGAGSLLPYSRRICAPTVVLHGTADALVPVASGRAVAKAIPRARLVTIPGWGHDLPVPLHRRLTEELLSVTRRAAPRAGTRSPER